jgi:hypothetical protein
MINEQPEPRIILIELLEMYGNQNNRNHIKTDMKRYLMSIRRDITLYGTLSEKQFCSIITYLKFEMKATEDKIRTFFAPCIRTGKGKLRDVTEPKSIKAEPNTLIEFLQKD